MLTLRPYQQAAIDGLYTYFQNNDGNPLIVLPTGTGKSLVMANFIQGAISQWPETRIIVGAHVRELVEQDYLEYVGLVPFGDTGIYSSGMNRRDTRNAVLFASIQSCYKRAFEFQRCDILIIDEAHTVPADGEGMWRTFIDELRRINPNLKIVGLTATDYRLATGLLTDGDIFTDVCYEYPLIKAVKEGYLSPVVPKRMATAYDLSNVATRGGEYVAGELEKVFDIDAKTMTALDEVEAYGVDRKSWLIFAAGNHHAEHVHMELQRRGYKGACVTQEAGSKERDDAVEGIRNGSIRYLVNNRIFTTGFNARNIDMIVDFGATKSPGLHVQKMGRGMRLWEGKNDCLVLDFAGNITFHGPLDQIKGRSKKKGMGGDAPVKVCPECHELCFAGIRVCFNCGHEFPAPQIDIRSTSYDAPILSSQIEPEWHDVIDVKYGYHKKVDKPLPTFKVTYITIAGRFMEWICFEHEGRAGQTATKWHNSRVPWEPRPKTVNEAVERCEMYKPPVKILVGKDGKWDRILDYCWLPKEIIEETFEIPF